MDIAKQFKISQGSISVLLSRIKKEKGVVWGRRVDVQRPVLSQSINLFKPRQPNPQGMRLMRSITTGAYSEVLFEGRLERVSKPADTNVLHNALCLETVYSDGNELNLVLLPSGKMQIILTAPNRNGLQAILKEQRGLR